MQAIILALLIVLIGLMGHLVWNSARKKKEPLEIFLNEKFNDFSEKMRLGMDNTRQEFERSKDAVSNGTIKTLEHLKSMSEVIGDLVKQQEKAQQLGQSLEYLLQAPKLRGNYGEAILEEMLDRVLPKGIWERQYAMASGERVDAVVKFKNVIIPIDAKFPKDDYQKYMSCEDTFEKSKHWANYERALKTQVNLIKDKYIKPEDGTTDFGLLFIPSEAIYYETIAERNYMGQSCQIYEYALNHKVIPVSPNTFYAFLHVITLGVQNIEISKEAKKLQELLTKIERDFDYFYGNFKEIGKALDKASKSFDVGERHGQRFKRDLGAALKLEIPAPEETEDAAIEETQELPEG